jgi:phytoene dehydrogenase-like protein
MTVLERRTEVGGAAVSGSSRAGVNQHARCFSELIGPFPAALARTLGVHREPQHRHIASVRYRRLLGRSTDRGRRFWISKAPKPNTP